VLRYILTTHANTIVKLGQVKRKGPILETAKETV